VLELVACLVLPEDLPDHGPQHDRVKEEHQAEETQVHDIMDQGARDPASGGRRKAEGYAVSSHRDISWRAWGKHEGVEQIQCPA